MPKDTKGNTFYLNNYIDWDLFNQLYDSEWQSKRIQSANAIVQKLMLASRKAMEQRQEARTRAAQRKKAPKKIDSGSWDQYEHDDYDTNESDDN